MFKAFIVKTQQDLILLDYWPCREDVLPFRDACKKGEIVCPECGTNLIVKAGEINTWHFAHQTQKTNKD